jgi:chemotaxis family two-component system response regulator PixH
MNRVLIVDDSLMIREVFCMYLQKAGFEVVKAANVGEAVNTLKSYQPELIILDIVMEGKSGFEFCHQLKKNRNTCSIPIIICSSKFTQADRLLGDIVGADVYFPKDIEEKDFIKTVQKMAGKPVKCRI